MHKFILTAAVAILFTSAAHAAEKQNSMTMDSDMMMKCQKHMKNGKMMGDMSEGMMAKCQKMMGSDDSNHMEKH